MTAEEFQKEAQAVRPDVLSLARKYLKDSDEAEDAVQDAMLKLWKMCDQLHSPMAPLASVLVRNLAIDRLRRRRPIGPLTRDVAEVQQERDEQERIERVMSIIATQPDTQQLLMRLRHQEGMEYAEIARLTGMSEVAVRKGISRARQAIRATYMERTQKESRK